MKILSFVCGIVFLLFSFFIIDSTFLPYQNGHALVLNKYLIPAHIESTIQTITVDQVTIFVPQTINHPERYYLTLQILGFTHNMEVNKNSYIETNVNTEVIIQYAKHRFRNQISIK